MKRRVLSQVYYASYYELNELGPQQDHHWLMLKQQRVPRLSDQQIMQLHILGTSTMNESLALLQFWTLKLVCVSVCQFEEFYLYNTLESVSRRWSRSSQFSSCNNCGSSCICLTKLGKKFFFFFTLMAPYY